MKQKAKHTPGEWKVDKERPAIVRISDCLRIEQIIETEYIQDAREYENLVNEECEANAELIASAPQLKAENEALKEANKELVEALQGLMANRIINKHTTANGMIRYNEALGKATEVITKHSK